MAFMRKQKQIMQRIKQLKSLELKYSTLREFLNAQLRKLSYVVKYHKVTQLLVIPYKVLTCSFHNLHC